MKIMEKEAFMTAKEIAKLLGMSEYFVYNEIKKGRLEAVKFGRIYKITERQLLDYIKSSRLKV